MSTRKAHVKRVKLQNDGGSYSDSVWIDSLRFDSIEAVRNSGGQAEVYNFKWKDDGEDPAGGNPGRVIDKVDVDMGGSTLKFPVVRKLTTVQSGQSAVHTVKNKQGEGKRKTVTKRVYHTPDLNDTDPIDWATYPSTWLAAQDNKDTGQYIDVEMVRTYERKQQQGPTYQGTVVGWKNDALLDLMEDSPADVDPDKVLRLDPFQLVVNVQKADLHYIEVTYNYYQIDFSYHTFGEGTASSLTAYMGPGTIAYNCLSGYPDAVIVSPGIIESVTNGFTASGGFALYGVGDVTPFHDEVTVSGVPDIVRVMPIDGAYGMGLFEYSGGPHSQYWVPSGGAGAPLLNPPPGSSTSPLPGSYLPAPSEPSSLWKDGLAADWRQYGFLNLSEPLYVAGGNGSCGDPEFGTILCIMEGFAVESHPCATTTIDGSGATATWTRSDGTVFNFVPIGSFVFGGGGSAGGFSILLKRTDLIAADGY